MMDCLTATNEAVQNDGKREMHTLISAVSPSAEQHQPSVRDFCFVMCSCCACVCMSLYWVDACVY